MGFDKSSQKPTENNMSPQSLWPFGQRYLTEIRPLLDTAKLSPLLQQWPSLLPHLQIGQ